MAKSEREQRSLFKRLTRIFKAGPIVRRKVRGRDTVLAVPDKSKTSGALLFQKSLSPTYATITSNAYNLSERLMRYQDFCLAGDTLVAMPSEVGALSIKEIVDAWEAGDVNQWVFSYDTEKRRIVPAKVTGARCNGVRQVVTVTLDDGSEIKCTPDHRFMLRDGSYLQACELTTDTALMPLNQRTYDSPYRYIHDGKRWRSEHVMVVESILDRQLIVGEHVHHKNFKHRDNRIENLEVLSVHDHMSLHAKINNQRFDDPAARQHMSTVMKKRWQNDGDLRINLDRTSQMLSDSRRQRRIEYNKTEKPGRFNAGRTDQKHSQNANADKSLTFQMICDAYQPGDTLKGLARKVNSTWCKVINRIKWQGYENFVDFVERYQNHKVVSVIDHGETMFVYDLEVAGHHNFALAKYAKEGIKSCDHQGVKSCDVGIKSCSVESAQKYRLITQGTVIVHNCEMELTPEISAALDIYSDETVAQDDKGRILHIHSDNPKIRETLEELYYNVLNVEFNLRPWVRNVVKFGDAFLYVNVSQEHGVVNAFPIPVNEIEREENYDRNDPFAVRFRWVTLGNRTLENWEVLHFRILGNDQFLPYGSSILDPARRIWRQLILIEDAMLVYRVIRAPERRVFYIDVGNVPPEHVQNYIEEQRKQLRTSQVIDQTQGRVDLRYNALSVDEDILVPVRGAETGTKIDTLPGGQNTAAVEDVSYIQKKLFAALKIPRAYLGYDDMLCLAPDTEIPLLDGTSKRIDELARLFEGAEKPILWTYSSLEDGTIVPSRILNAWQTKTVDELYRVTLDDGSVLECTGNHPFMLRDGSYRRADELTPETSLMPLYRRLSVNKKRGGLDLIDGYEMVLQNNDGEWSYTHKLVNEHVTGGNHKVNKCRVIHHADFNKKNNQPENLVEMTWAEHRKFHSDNLETTWFRPDVIERREINKIAALKSPHHRQLKSVQMKAQHADENSALSAWVHGDEIHEKMSSVMRDNWNDPEYRAVKSQQNRDLWNDPKYRSKYVGDGHWSRRKKAEYTIDWLIKFCKENEAYEWSCWSRKTIPAIASLPIGFSYVRSLIMRSGFEDWYDFAVKALNYVPKKHILWGVKRARRNAELNLTPETAREACLKHGLRSSDDVVAASRSGLINFGCAALKGMLSDHGMTAFEFFTSVGRNHKIVNIELIRVNSSDSRVNSSVPVYDLEIEGTHNFPIICRSQSPLNTNDCASTSVLSAVFVHNSSRSTLAQEDIRFSRTITSIQKTILAELNKLAVIHLYANGFDGDDLQNFTLRLSNPSTVAQQQKLELWRQKFEIAASLPETMGSTEFVMSEVWGLNAAQIKAIKRQRTEDKLFDAQLEAAVAAGGGGGGEGDDTTTEGLFGAAGGGEEGGTEAPAEEPTEPAPENASEEPEEEGSPELELLTSSDNAQDDLEIVQDNDRTPVKPNPTLHKYLYNRSRRRMKTNRPDFVKMTGPSASSLSDPNDTSWLKDPFKESVPARPRIGLGPDVLSMLRNAQSAGAISAPRERVLSEQRDVQDEVDGIVELDDDDDDFTDRDDS